ncbi:hypothetical protein [Rhodococcus sp. 27YEA15]|uniref:hypothetical protein n=1 Tax=Rhodococcus sp. 27YEA15 TaxID=3156259 RepID=UPI003C7DC6E0
MTDDDRALLRELGEDPDDPRWIADYAHLDKALADYSTRYHHHRSGLGIDDLKQECTE